jgi:hypothetical protein
MLEKKYFNHDIKAFIGCYSQVANISPRVQTPVELKIPILAAERLKFLLC